MTLKYGYATLRSTFQKTTAGKLTHLFASERVLCSQSDTNRRSPRALLRSWTAIPFLFALLASLALLPATASGYATIEGPPEFSAAPGLPDGRVYEQVSPADKHGNEAGGSTALVDSGALNHYGIASADGNAVLFEGTGPIGKSPSGSSKWFVATKNVGERGWSTRSLLSTEKPGVVNGAVEQLDPSSDLSHAIVKSPDLLGGEGCPQLFLTSPDPFVAAAWLGRPEIKNPVEHCETFESAPVGGTPDFTTVYFTYAGTLLPKDTERASHADGGEAWGFYENREGALREAGILPDEKLDSLGAVPAASGHGRNPHGDEVSVDGSRAFFVSPDPASCEPAGQNDCATDPPELYVRENGERTLLVSKDTLLPESGGLPASAPSGVLAVPDTAEQPVANPDGSYVFASPDGSQAFFQSASALTKPAKEASPGAEPKTYDFDVSAGTLTYLPGVVLGEILAVDGDGSSMAFLRPAAGGAPADLDLWSAGPGGGSVTPVTQLPGPGASVPEARISSDDSVLVFQTADHLSGAFNSGGTEQIYRYDVAANALGCVSCAPAGVTAGGASMSILHADEIEGKESSKPGTVDERGISADGERVFFETLTPLVPQDSNTSSPPFPVGEGGELESQGRDVYEWENGVVYLISTGRSLRNSFLLDSSANGNDVFFATAEGLVPGDTDGGYDVYDARIPHAGEPYPPAAVPCEGSVCQGPPHVESPLAPPARATFPGSDNLTAEPATAPPPKKTTTKTVKCKKGFTKKNNKCVKSKKKKTKAKKSAKGRA